MDNKEAIKYLISPISTSTEPSAEYLKQKEAYELAIKALEEKPQGEWVVVPERCFIYCKECGHVKPFSAEEFKLGINFPNFCEECGADMKGGAE